MISFASLFPVLVFNLFKRDGVQKYVDATVELGHQMAENGYGLVWGASDTGLMKVIADSVSEGGSALYGVSIVEFDDIARKDLKDLIIADSLAQRKGLMLQRADAIICLVGGTGTLDEITEIIELKKIKAHTKPIVILNTDNFYEGFKVQLERMNDEGFLKSNLGNINGELVHFCEYPSEAIEYINRHLK